MTGPETDEPYLKVENLTVRFPTADGLVQAVTDLSYQVGLGQTLGIVGESGSGKSVSSMAVLGLHDARSAQIEGSITVGGTEIVGLSEAQLRPLRGNSVAMIFQDALAALHPFYKVGKQLAEAYVVHHPSATQARRPQAGDRDARPRRHPATGPTGRPVPAPVLRRHAAARDDRDGPDQRPVAPHRRRADHRSRRHRAGADPRPAPGPAARVQLGDRDHHPRPRRHCRDGRRRPGDVRRSCGRVRRVPRRADPPGDALHLGAPVERSRRECGHQCADDPDPGQPAEPARPADRLRLPPAVRAPRQGPGRPVLDHVARAAARHARRRTPQAVPPGQSRRDLRGRSAARDRPRHGGGPDDDRRTRSGAHERSDLATEA